MKITLTDEEIRIILANAISEKTNDAHGEADIEDCFFTIYDEEDKKIEQSVLVEFTWSKEN